MKLATIYFLCLLLPLAGFAQWSDDPSLNTKIIDTLGMQLVPKVVVSDNGESYVSWYDQLDTLTYFEMRLQHLDADGMKLWSDEGLQISNHPTWSWVTDYDLVMDTEGHAILVMQDARNGFSDVFAYRISPDGTFEWGPDGIALTNDDHFDPSPKAVVTTDENIVVMWGVEPSDTTEFCSISLQKLSKDGQTLWDDITILSNDTMHYLMPHMIPTEDNGVILVWVKSVTTDTIMGNWPYMYPVTQKIDGDGNEVWPEHLVLDTAKNMPLSFFAPSMVSDGNNGFFLGWMAFPQGLFYSCYLQHVNSDGIPQWTTDGMNVSDSVQYQHTDPSLVYLPQHEELFVFWNVLDENEWREAVNGQKYSTDGQNQWTAGGKRFLGWHSALDTLIMANGIIKATEDDFTLFYYREYLIQAGRDAIICTDLFARRIDRDGNPVWENGDLVYADALSGKGFLNVTRMANDQHIAVWGDNRQDPTFIDETGIYAQNITIHGNLGPTAVFEPVRSEDMVISTYPNPVDNTFTISYRTHRGGAMDIYLYDITGSLIRQLASPYQHAGDHSYELDVSELTAGVYILKLQYNSITGYHKFIKR